MSRHFFTFFRFVSATILFCCGTVSPISAYTLFHGGKSSYKIVLSPSASISEQTAARELQHYINDISGGAFLPIVHTIPAKGPRIFIGYDTILQDLIGWKSIAEDDETFTYETRGKDLFIYGGRQRGTMYGVFTFLENELGLRWYTPTCTKIPHLRKWTFNRLYHTESPALLYRYSNYYGVSNADTWSAHNKENTKWTPKANAYGNLEGYWSAHTMGRLVPAEEFFQTHPEYFSLRDGKRTPSQLCLSNPDVLQICKERLLRQMDREPLYRIYSLSQNDNFGYCQCDKCKAIEEQYGGHSGLIVWFVNQVADAVKPLHPDKYVGTFAYQYSRRPPRGISPRDNVVIRLCDIECCFAHPLDAGCPQNKPFMDDLDGWKQIAPHIFIWDYIVDYAQYIAPWPNFQVLAPNIRLFADHKAIGIFEEAQYQSPSSEFCELKTWVATKLLWNPLQDTELLVKDFIEGYYGKAAPAVMDYYHLCQSLVKPDKHYGIYIREKDPVYTDPFVQQGEAILRTALRQAENAEIRQRTERVLMQVLYLKHMRRPQESFRDGTWDELVTLMRKYNARPGEGMPLENFIAGGQKKATRQ